MSAHVEEFTDARGRDVGTRFCLLEVYFKPEPGKVENLGEPWRTLENLGEPWRTLENLGEPWRTLENLGEPWRTLENLGEPWRTRIGREGIPRAFENEFMCRIREEIPGTPRHRGQVGNPLGKYAGFMFDDE
ncbi:MAG: hypothetical protein ACTSUE_00355 [Promethearchaeota archaeon]